MKGGQMLKKRTWLFALLLTMYLGSSYTLAQPLGNINLMGTAWMLESLNSKLPVLEAQITLESRTWVLGGWDGCNWYGGPYKAGQTRFTIEPGLKSTMMGCGKVWGRQVDAYGNALYKAATYRMNGDRLELLDGAGTVTLTFTRGAGQLKP